MLTIGTVLAILSGLGVPFFIFMIGLVFDEFTSYSTVLSLTIDNASNEEYVCNTTDEKLEKYFSSNDLDQQLRNEIALLSYYTLAVATGYLFSSIISKFLWSYSSLRQTNHLRICFLRSLLCKEIAWYDLNHSTEMHCHITRYVCKSNHAQENIQGKL